MIGSLYKMQSEFDQFIFMKKTELAQTLDILLAIATC